MILELIENLVILPIILALLYIAIIIIIEIGKGLTLAKAIKLFFCVMLSVTIILSTFVVMFLEVYQAGVIWKEYEVENVLDPRIKSISFNGIILIWNLLCVGLLFLIWRFIYFHQIISGVGTVKQRIKLHFAQLKKEA